MLVLAGLSPLCPFPATAGEGQETYAISLVKTAEWDKDVRQVEDKRVLTEIHTVRKGEYIWKIMRGKGLLENKPEVVEEFLRIMKRLNPSLQDLDLIHPGQRIVIPLKIVPAVPPEGHTAEPPPKKVSPAELMDLDLKTYTVRRGDNLTRIVKRHFSVPDRDLSEAYLDKIRELNPAIKDPNIIHPGQVIRLPVYSPQIVRRSIEPPPSKAEAVPQGAPGADAGPRSLGSVEEGLAYVFAALGEEWIRTGRHFIPLKSAGQVELKADAFPILALRSGRKVIVDLLGGFPPQMPALIESSWGNYKVVRLAAADDLRSALAKVMGACDYREARQDGGGLEWSGDVPFRVAGDWIVGLPVEAPGGGPRAAVIRLRGDSDPEVPPGLKRYFHRSGVSVVEYPPPREGEAVPQGRETEVPILGDPATLVRTVLEATGRNFSVDAEIPVFQGGGAAFKMSIRADFLLRVHERDAVIDLHRLTPEMVALLRDHGFLVLSLAEGTDGPGALARVLEFLHIPFDGGPHEFGIPHGVGMPKAAFTLSGVVFPGARGRLLAARTVLPDEIAAYLAEQGYTILDLSF